MNQCDDEFQGDSELLHKNKFTICCIIKIVRVVINEYLFKILLQDILTCFWTIGNQLFPKLDLVYLRL